jgi:hypothetical protein
LRPCEPTAEADSHLTVDQQEYLARSFEALHKGRKVTLGDPFRVFSRFKAWLVSNSSRAWISVCASAMASSVAIRIEHTAEKTDPLREEVRPTVDSQPDIVALRYLRGDTLPDSHTSVICRSCGCPARR